MTTDNTKTKNFIDKTETTNKLLILNDAHAGNINIDNITGEGLIRLLNILRLLDEASL